MRACGDNYPQTCYGTRIFITDTFMIDDEDTLDGYEDDDGTLKGTGVDEEDENDLEDEEDS